MPCFGLWPVLTIFLYEFICTDACIYDSDSDKGDNKYSNPDGSAGVSVSAEPGGTESGKSVIEHAHSCIFFIFIN